MLSICELCFLRCFVEIFMNCGSAFVLIEERQFMLGEERQFMLGEERQFNSYRDILAFESTCPTLTSH